MDQPVRSSLQQQFGPNAAAYTTSESHAKGDDLSLLFQHLPLRSSDAALDIATGTGHTAFALAPRVAHVTGLDLVPEMLEEATRAAAQKGLTNIAWEKGDALRTGLPGEFFDVVTCRRAAHHFGDVPAFLTEVRRVLKTGGFFALVDQVSSDDPQVAAVTEEMEKIHDPSHVKALSPESWRTAMQAAGFRETFFAVQKELRTLRQFLADTDSVPEKQAKIQELWAHSSEPIKKSMELVEGESDSSSFLKMRLVAIFAKD